MSRSKWIKRILAVLGIIVLIGIAGFVIYFSHPMPAMPVALAAMRSSDTVTVTDLSDQIIFMPAAAPKAALVFYPGARVDPAAYAARLRPLAENGYAVFIPKFPLNLAIFGANRARDIMAAHPKIKKWAIGGHSMGGAFAGSYLQGRTDIQGQVMYASYPAKDLSQMTDLASMSIYGTNDGLATVDKIENAKPTMPLQTEYVPIVGGIHSYFGDYGIQPGDGTPTISREEAASQIVAATLKVMDEVASQ
jgi:hypothetical protein